MTISTRFPRVSQPPDVPKIDVNNPLSAGISSLHYGGTLGLRNLISLVVPTLNSGASILPSSAGSSIKFNGSSDGFSYPITYTSPDSFTLAVVLQFNSVSAGSGTIIDIGSGTSGRIRLSRSTNQIQFLISDSLTGRFMTSGVTHASGEVIKVICTYNAAEPRARLYINGVDRANDGITLPIGTVDTIQFGHNIGASTGYFDGNILLSAFWPKKSLSAIERKSFFSNPWQLFAPLEKPLFSAIDSVRIRGPKPRQVVPSSQTQVRTQLAPPFLYGAFFAKTRLVAPGSSSINMANDRAVLTKVGYALSPAVQGVSTGTPVSFPVSAFKNGQRPFTILVYVPIDFVAPDNSYQVFGTGNTQTGILCRIYKNTTYNRVSLQITDNWNNVIILSHDITVAQDFGLLRFDCDTVVARILWNGEVVASGNLLRPLPSDASGVAILSGSSWSPKPRLAYCVYGNFTLPDDYAVRNPWQVFASAEQPFWHTELVQPKKFFPVLALPVPKNITANSVTPQVTLSF